MFRLMRWQLARDFGEHRQIPYLKCPKEFAEISKSPHQFRNFRTGFERFFLVVSALSTTTLHRDQINVISNTADADGFFEYSELPTFEFCSFKILAKLCVACYFVSRRVFASISLTSYIFSTSCSPIPYAHYHHRTSICSKRSQFCVFRRHFVFPMCISNFASCRWHIRKALGLMFEICRRPKVENYLFLCISSIVLRLEQHIELGRDIRFL